jgi:acyl-CoA thioesterase I
MRMSARPRFLVALAAALLLLLAPAVRAAALPAGFDAAAALDRSIVSVGSFERIGQVFARARRGDTITIGAIGGSVTQGAWADTPDGRYLDRVGAWWRAHFPQARTRLVNAGIGGTQSNYGALRAQRDLLAAHPDVVIVEFSVNDDWNDASVESYEGVVRHILHAPQHPAVLLLNMADRAGNSAEPYHRRVGAYYNLPEISFGDALRPYYAGSPSVAGAFYKDAVHPDALGHAFIAELVEHWLDLALASADGQEDRPLTSNVYDGADLHEGASLPPVAVSGWTFHPDLRAWEADQPGATLSWDVSGAAVFITYFTEHGPWGTAAVSVDDNAPVLIDAWFAPTYGGQARVKEIARDLPPGRHRVTVRVLPQSNPQSGGHRFRLFGVGTSGP